MKNPRTPYLILIGIVWGACALAAIGTRDAHVMSIPCFPTIIIGVVYTLRHPC